MDQVSISASQFSALTSPKIGMLASGQFSLLLPFFFSSSAIALFTLLYQLPFFFFMNFSGMMTQDFLANGLLRFTFGNHQPCFKTMCCYVTPMCLHLLCVALSFTIFSERVV
jgi:hypothetical protein